MLARRILPGLAALLVLAVATPALAADPHKGWYGALDLALTQPAGLDQHYANQVDFDNACNFDCTETERLVLDNDSALTWGAAFGYSWGKMGALQVSYWGFGNNDSFSDDSAYGGIYPTVAGYTYDIGGGYLYGDTYNGGVDFEAESDTRATVWDIDFIHPMVGGEKISVNWLAGLRVAEYRENRFFDGTDFYYGSFDDRYVQDHHQMAKGWGFKVGVSANMDFTQHLGIVADLAVSFLQASNRGNLSNCSDSCSNDPNVGDEQDDVEGSDDSSRGEIRDYGLKAVWHQGPVDIFVGFRSSNWEGLVSDPAPPIGGGFFGIGSAGSDGRNDVTFNSWHVGAKWRIGG